MEHSFFTSVLLVVDADSSHKDHALHYITEHLLADSEKLKPTDLEWVNLEGEGIKISEVRQLISTLSYSTYKGEKRYVVLAQVDTASLPAQNALLKSIEEPPAQTQLILTTSRPDKVLPTIKSRCVAHYFTLQKSDTQKEDAELLQLYTSLKTMPLYEKISLAAQHKKREEALTLVHSLILFLEKNLQDFHTTADVQNLKTLVKTLEMLEQNCNPKLTLENGLFAISQ